MKILVPFGRGRLDVALLLCVSALVLTFDFGARVFASNDEARFPMLARDILAHGTWLLPRLGGIPHLYKPPLYAWLIALVSWPSGDVSQATAALPSVVAALGVVIATYGIARRLFNDAESALGAGLIVVTTYGVFVFARVAMPDMTLCFALTAALAAFAAAEFGGRRWALGAAYALVGVASLTKGPVALLGLVVMLVYPWSVDGWAGLRRVVSPLGFLVLGLVAVPWWLLGAASDRAGLTHDVVVADWLFWYLPQGGRSWRAATDPIVQPVTVLLPWALLLPWAFSFAARTTEADFARRVRFPVVWASVIFVFIAFSQQQRTRYYLPLCPPVALVVAAWYSRLTLPHKHAIGATAWLIAALGQGLWQAHAGTRHNAATDLGTMVSLAATRTKPVYVVGLPELTLAFYLKQPVARLEDYRQFEVLVREGREGWLAIDDRGLPGSSLAPRLQRLGGGRMNGHPFSILTPGS